MKQSITSGMSADLLWLHELAEIFCPDRVENPKHGPSPTPINEPLLSKEENEIYSKGQKGSRSATGKLLRKGDEIYADFGDNIRTRIDLVRFEHIAAFMMLAKKHLPEITGNEIDITAELLHHEKSEFRSHKMHISHFGGLVSEVQLKTKLQALADDITHGGLYKVKQKLEIIGKGQTSSFNDNELGDLSYRLESLRSYQGFPASYKGDPSKLNPAEIEQICAVCDRISRQVYMRVFAMMDLGKHEMGIRGAAIALGKGRGESKLDKVDTKDPEAVEVARIMRDREWQKNDSGIVVPKEHKDENQVKIYKYAGKQQDKLNHVIQKLYEIYEKSLKTGMLDLASGMDENMKVRFFTRAYELAMRELASALEGQVDNPLGFITSNYGDMIGLIDTHRIIPVADQLEGEKASYFKSNYDNKYRKLTKPGDGQFKSAVHNTVKTIQAKEKTDLSF